MPAFLLSLCSQSVEDADGYLLYVKEGGSATFSGKFVGKGVENAYSMFKNEGAIE